MKKLLLLALISLFSLVSVSLAEARSYRSSSSDTYVKGYTKKNGSYVAPHYKTRSNSTKKDNYSCIDYGRCR